ncbi:MAG: exo-alpha-sialidase [Cyclobacteriaceae bacterium]|nr:exo-alpha-sialidase [Cyclobacteriaceae bacterium]
MRTWVLFFGVLMSIECSAQFKNIKIADELNGFSPINSSIAINHKDSKNIVAAVSLNRSVYTLDGGTTWAESKVPSVFGGGNPLVISDMKGHFYYFHQSDPGGKGKGNENWMDRVVLQKSDDGGATWGEENFFGLNPSKNQSHFTPSINAKKSILYSAWTQFDQYGLDDASCQSSILFSVSSNGSKWSKPLQLSQTPGDCMDGNKTAANATAVVSLDGKMYAAWTLNEVIFFDRSYDGGDTWLSNDLAIGKQIGGWALSNIPGVKLSNSRPTLIIDTSPTRVMNSLYVAFADQRNGANDTDIWFMRSVNRGDNWTSPFRINSDGKGHHQFSPAIAVDASSAFIYVVYYDRRNYEDNQTDVYLSYSFDGGNVFYEKKISETPFTPTDTGSLGDVINIAASDGIITPIWSRMDDGKVSVWTTIIKVGDLSRGK